MHSLTALQCWGTSPSLSSGSRPCLTAPARPWRESRARSTAGMGLAVGYLRSCEQALTPCVCQPPPLSSPQPSCFAWWGPTFTHHSLACPHPLVTGDSQGLFPTCPLARGLCQQPQPGTGQQQRRPHTPCAPDRPGSTKKDNIGAGRYGRNRRRIGTITIYYIHAGMGLDEFLHQCRTQAEVPTAGMSMINMLMWT